MELRKLLVTIVSSLITSAVAAQSGALPDLSAFAVGERWEWRQVDNRSQREEGRRSAVVTDENGVRAMMVDGIQRPLPYLYVLEPSSKPWRVWPLEVGKKWSIDIDYVGSDGTKGNLKQEARVVAYEEVSVPAGKFMAFKIEQDGFVHTSPLALQAFNGRIVDTYWYAPVARADAKHIRRVGTQYFTRELVKYPAPHVTAQQLSPASAATPAGSNAAVQKPGPTTATTSQDSRLNRLRELEQLRKEGLITQHEYEEKRKAILSTL